MVLTKCSMVHNQSVMSWLQLRPNEHLRIWKEVSGFRGLSRRAKRLKELPNKHIKIGATYRCREAKDPDAGQVWMRQDFQ
jgi:hypothetical protein